MIKNIIVKLCPHLVHFAGCFRAEVVRPFYSFPKKYRKGSLFKYMYNYIIYGCSVDEYNCLFFYERSAKSKKTFVTIRKNRKLDKIFNTEEANKILWDKGLFNEYFKQFNHRQYLQISVNTTDEQLLDFANSNASGYLVKPDDLYYGKGIYKSNGLEELKKLCSSGRSYIVEEIVTNCPELTVLNPTSLNTLRCVTCLDKNGDVHFITIALRTGGKGAVVDNVLSGGTYYHVDIETGIIDRPGMDAYGNGDYLLHPASGVMMPGFKIPRFAEMKDFVIQLAKHLPDARYVGWDIAITPDGFEVIEGNVSPGACSLQCDQVGRYKGIRSLL